MFQSIFEKKEKTIKKKENINNIKEEIELKNKKKQKPFININYSIIYGPSTTYRQSSKYSSDINTINYSSNLQSSPNILQSNNINQRYNYFNQIKNQEQIIYIMKKSQRNENILSKTKLNNFKDNNRLNTNLSTDYYISNNRINFEKKARKKKIIKKKKKEKKLN